MQTLFQLPVALSIAVTFVSSITVLGIPAHAYVYGTVVIWFAFSICVQITIACIYYIPLFHRLKLSSVYEVSCLTVSQTFKPKSMRGCFRIVFTVKLVEFLQFVYLHALYFYT